MIRNDSDVAEQMVDANVKDSERNITKTITLWIAKQQKHHC